MDLDEAETDFLSPEKEAQKIYQQYTTSLPGALPDVRDGLKRVQRNLLYAMEELEIKPGRFNNSSRIVEYALRARSFLYIFNQFSDISPYEVYDTLVRMVQDFSVRYPLVDGQGNFSSIYWDPPTGMYHSCTGISKIGVEMLRDLRKGTVAFFPTVLPSAIPNLLIVYST